MKYIIPMNNFRFSSSNLLKLISRHLIRIPMWQYKLHIFKLYVAWLPHMKDAAKSNDFTSLILYIVYMMIRTCVRIKITVVAQFIFYGNIKFWVGQMFNVTCYHIVNQVFLHRVTKSVCGKKNLIYHLYSKQF
jgi:hypothetical protein